MKNTLLPLLLLLLVLSESIIGGENFAWKGGQGGARECIEFQAVGNNDGVPIVLSLIRYEYGGKNVPKYKINARTIDEDLFLTIDGNVISNDISITIVVNDDSGDAIFLKFADAKIVNKIIKTFKKGQAKSFKELSEFWNEVIKPAADAKKSETK